MLIAGEAMNVEGGGFKQKLSVPCPLFYFEHKTALQCKVYLKMDNRNPVLKSYSKYFIETVFE